MWAGVGKSGSPAPNRSRSRLRLQGLGLRVDGERRGGGDRGERGGALHVRQPATAGLSSHEIGPNRPWDRERRSAMLVGVSVDPATIIVPADLLPPTGASVAARRRCAPSRSTPSSPLVPPYSARPTATRGEEPRRLRAPGLTELFSLPDGWESRARQRRLDRVLGRRHVRAGPRPQPRLVFGEFSSKFADAATAAPHLGEPTVIRRDRYHPEAAAEDGVDLYASPTTRRRPVWRWSSAARPAPRRPALVAVDATSAAGGLRWNPTEVDVYYFAPQKCFASDGGLWLAACSPAAIERINEIGSSDRWRPASLDLQIALDNSTKNQTTTRLRCHPGDARRAAPVDERRRRLDFAAGRSDASAATLYAWADASDFATPFVADPAQRSTWSARST